MHTEFGSDEIRAAYYHGDIASPDGPRLAGPTVSMSAVLPPNHVTSLPPHHVTGLATPSCHRSCHPITSLLPSAPLRRQHLPSTSHYRRPTPPSRHQHPTPASRHRSYHPHHITGAVRSIMSLASAIPITSPAPDTPITSPAPDTHTLRHRSYHPHHVTGA